jgi:WD40 repeat protein
MSTRLLPLDHHVHNERGLLHMSMDVTKDGQNMVFGGVDGKVHTWCIVDTTEKSIIKRGELSGHLHPVRSVAWSPDGRQIVSGSYDTTVRLWDVTGDTPTRVLQGHTHWVTIVAWSPDSLRIASGSNDGTVRLWYAVSGAPGPVLGCSYSVMSAAWSPDSQQIASSSYDRTVRLWSTASGTPGHVLRGHTDWVVSVAWSPNGEQIVSGSYDMTVRLWDAANGAPGPVLQCHTKKITSVAWSCDGLRIVSTSKDNTVRLWNAVAGALPTETHVCERDPIQVFCLPDRRIVVHAIDAVKVLCSWSDRNNHVFKPRLRQPIFVLMCVRQRLKRGGNAIPPMELWLEICAGLACLLHG